MMTRLNESDMDKDGGRADHGYASQIAISLTADHLDAIDLLRQCSELLNERSQRDSRM